MKQPNSITLHAFTIKHQGRVDRIVTKVQIAPAFNPENPPDPLPKFYDTNALWDTGATKSIITKATAEILGLVPVGQVMVTHAGGTSPANTYLANFFLPNNVGVAGVLVCECPQISNHAGALIGMDIISQGDFSITNVGGETWMSFRTPSFRAIDYVKELNELRDNQGKADKLKHKVGRNDPCPCGSGKKFKKCHGA